MIIKYSNLKEKTWNWLPIGDGFVDYVSIRDTNSWITSRELDSVMVWLNSTDSVFHIMRGTVDYRKSSDYITSILFLIKVYFD